MISNSETKTLTKHISLTNASDGTCLKNKKIFNEKMLIHQLCKQQLLFISNASNIQEISPKNCKITIEWQNQFECCNQMNHLASNKGYIKYNKKIRENHHRIEY